MKEEIETWENGVYVQLVDPVPLLYVLYTVYPEQAQYLHDQF